MATQLRIGGKPVGEVASVTQSQQHMEYFDLRIPVEQQIDFTLNPRRHPTEKSANWLVASDFLEENGFADAAKALRVLAEAVVERGNVTVIHHLEPTWPSVTMTLWWPAGPAAVDAAEVFN